MSIHISTMHVGNLQVATAGRSSFSSYYQYKSDTSTSTSSKTLGRGVVAKQGAYELKNPAGSVHNSQMKMIFYITIFCLARIGGGSTRADAVQFFPGSDCSR